MSPPALRTRGRCTVTGISKNPPGSTRKVFNQQCQFCEKAFSKTEHLLRHERSHTKERPFRCTPCNKAYSRHDTLLRHIKSHDSRTSSDMNGNISSNAAVRDIQASLPLNDYANAQDVSTVDSPQRESTVQNWQDPSRTLQSMIHAGRTNLADESLLTSGHVSTTQSQDTRHFYTSCGTHHDESEMLQDRGLLSMPLPVINGDSPLSANNLWGDLPWLVGYDFDLEALNTSVSATLDISQPLFQSRGFQSVQPILEDHVELAAEEQLRYRSGTDKVRGSWFTQIEYEGLEDVTHGDTSADTRQLTPVTGENQYDIGDNFRSRITARLRAPTFDDPLPSTKFLNHSIQVYFTKFNHIFPVIHGQTFRPSPKNSLLLLSITSIGSLLLGSRAAAAQGTRIFERLNKAILASWEQSLIDPSEAKSMIEAALIGQTFGFVSGIPKHLAIVEAFHGTVIAWARRCKLFTHKFERPDVANLTGNELHKAWNSWARSEEIVRTIHGLYIHDAMLARLFHHSPLLRHDAINMPPAADDSIFNATTAEAWKLQILDQSFGNTPLRECLHVNLHAHLPSQPAVEELHLKNSRQTAYVVINGISALVSEKQQMGQLVHSSTEFSTCFDALTCWYFTFARPDWRNANDGSQSDVFLRMIVVLWHTIFMELVTNFDILERAVGRDGSDSPTAQHDLDYAYQWANSKDAQRCIFHAHSLLHLVGQMRLDTEPAIHIPHCLFLAGIATYSYTKFHRSEQAVFQDSDSQQNRTTRIETRDVLEFLKCGIPIPKHLFQSAHTSPLANKPFHHEAAIEGNQDAAGNAQNRLRPHSGPVTGLLFTINDLLQRIGHWGVARKFAATLSTLATNDGDEDWALMMNDC